jgi:hypothetical protein
VDLAFSDPRLQQLCASLAMLKDRLGDRCAQTAIAHLASLRAASCLDEFRQLPGRCTEQDGQLILLLPEHQELVFEPVDDPALTDGDGALDWSAVRSIRILKVGDPRSTTRR